MYIFWSLTSTWTCVCSLTGYYSFCKPVPTTTADVSVSQNTEQASGDYSLPSPKHTLILTITLATLATLISCFLVVILMRKGKLSCLRKQHEDYRPFVVSTEESEPDNFLVDVNNRDLAFCSWGLQSKTSLVANMPHEPWGGSIVTFFCLIDFHWHLFGLVSIPCKQLKNIRLFILQFFCIYSLWK